MARVLYIPLDERPCNYKYPNILPKTSLEIIRVPQEYLGHKKNPANVNMIASWLLENIKNADYLVTSLDMLIYGGLLPSRIHQLDVDVLEGRLNLLKQLKTLNPKVKIYAFSLIMRTPKYSSNDEEPDYYGDYGREIFELGVLEHKEKLKIINHEEQQKLKNLLDILPKEIISDYINRREKNIRILERVLELYKEKYLDYFVIPQDDSYKLGYTALDQAKIEVKKQKLNINVLTYPGADEVGLMLLGRVLNEIKNFRPKIGLLYASEKGPDVIPLYEDRPFQKTLISQIEVLGGTIVENNPDFVLAINIGSGMNDYNEDKNHIFYDEERDLQGFVDKISRLIQKNIKVAIADVAYANMGDLELIKLLDKENILFKVLSYAGWNTSSNTLGTTLAAACFKIFSNDSDSFLVYRYLEDVYYCGYARLNITKSLAQYGLNYFDISSKQSEIEKLIVRTILAKVELETKSLLTKFHRLEVKSPWSRMFEVELIIS